MMEWWVILSAGLAILLALFMIGIPIFLAFLIISVAGVLARMGETGFGMFANSIFETTNTAALATIALFILMGELLFRSGTIEVVYSTPWTRSCAACAAASTCCASRCRPSSERCPAPPWAWRRCWAGLSTPVWCNVATIQICRLGQFLPARASPR
jgi:hypothetical protein